MTKPSRAKRVAVLNDKFRKSLLTGSVGFTRKSATVRRKVFNVLKTSASTPEYQFRSTEAISSAVKLTESRVEQVFIKHPKIKRNTGEKQSRKLVS